MITSKASEIAVEALLEAYRQTSFWLDSSGVEMAVLQNHGIPAWASLEGFRDALEEARRLFGEPVNMMVNRLAPRTSVPVHVDAATPYARWHLPILTNDQARWWDQQSGWVQMAVGSWWGPVPFDRPHRVVNEGGVDRVHLIVDVAP